MMPSNLHNSTIAKAMSLFFFSVQHHFGPRGTFGNVKCILHGPSFVFYSFLLTAKSVDSVVAHDGFLFVMENFLHFSY